jgi:hypothetical protein
VVWHDIACGGFGRVWTYNMVDGIMKDYTDKAWIIIVLVCIIFWLMGCSYFETKEEVKTYPLPEEDPILEKLIELNVYEVEEIYENQ